MSPRHHLASTVGSHALIQTICGRTFDPNVCQEMISACCDHQWASAIQKGLQEDTEYVEMLQSEGGAALTLQRLSKTVKHDNEFLEKMKELLVTDRRVAIALCAMQDSYLRIRSKRDAHETRAAADGRDDVEHIKKERRLSFGQLGGR